MQPQELGVTLARLKDRERENDNIYSYKKKLKLAITYTYFTSLAGYVLSSWPNL